MRNGTRPDYFFCQKIVLQNPIKNTTRTLAPGSVFFSKVVFIARIVMSSVAPYMFCILQAGVEKVKTVSQKIVDASKGAVPSVSALTSQKLHKMRYTGADEERVAMHELDGAYDFIQFMCPSDELQRDFYAHVHSLRKRMDKAAAVADLAKVDTCALHSAVFPEPHPLCTRALSFLEFENAFGHACAEATANTEAKRAYAESCDDVKGEFIPPVRFLFDLHMTMLNLIVCMTVCVLRFAICGLRQFPELWALKRLIGMFKRLCIFQCIKSAKATLGKDYLV